MTRGGCYFVNLEYACHLSNVVARASRTCRVTLAFLVILIVPPIGGALKNRVVVILVGMTPLIPMAQSSVCKKKIQETTTFVYLQ